MCQPSSTFAALKWKLSIGLVTALRLDVAGSLPGSSARDIAITLRRGVQGIPTSLLHFSDSIFGPFVLGQFQIAGGHWR